MLSEDQPVLTLFHERKPFVIEVRVELLVAPVADNHTLSAERDLSLLLRENCVAILFIFSDNLLPPYSRDQHLAILKELNAHHLVTGVEYFAFHHCRNIVEYVVACIIQKRANHRQGCHVASEILH